METVLVLNQGLQNPDFEMMGRPARYRVNALKVIDEMVVGLLECEVRGGVCTVLGAKVHPDHRRMRIGHEMMFELERRWPGVTTAQPQNIASQSVPDWHAQKAEIMRTGNPHLGRDDLPPYLPTVLPEPISPPASPPST
jgi:hypothetical protein